MKILITGGTGFIGSRLAVRCKQRGDDVVILAQVNTPAEKENTAELEKQGFTMVIGGVDDKAVVAKAVAGCERLYFILQLPNMKLMLVISTFGM